MGFLRSPTYVYPQTLLFALHPLYDFAIVTPFLVPPAP